MSVFEINRLCRELLRNHTFRSAMKEDPVKALASLDLGKDERQALLDGDIATLHRMGVNEFLMGYLTRFEVCGLTLPVFNERMRAIKSEGGSRSVPAKPKGYVIIQTDMHDMEAAKSLMAANDAVFRKFGARFVARGGRSEQLNGSSKSRTVLVEFKDYETALAWYHSPEYQRNQEAARKISSSDMIVVEGYIGPQPS